MKKSFAVVFGTIVLCVLLMCPAIVSAYVSGYEYTDYSGTSTHVVDGKWTTSDEWTDAMTVPNLVSGFSWRASWGYVGSDIVQYFIIEVFTDTAINAGDIVRVCYDCAASGGTAPQSDDIKLEMVGDKTSGFSVYKGNGTGWSKITVTATDAAAAVSISSSPLNSTPHLIVEFSVDKSTIADVSVSGYAPWIYVGAYDANAAATKSWPPAPTSSADIPNSYGLETGTTATIPESVTIGAVVILSVVAVGVSFYFLPKRQKLKISVQGK